MGSSTKYMQNGLGVCTCGLGMIIVIMTNAFVLPVTR